MGLNIAVLVKAAIDPNMLRTSPDGRVLVEEMPIAISEYDKNAVEAAVQLKEKHGGRVVAFSVLTWGPIAKRKREIEQVMREALAMGADEAHVVVDEAALMGTPFLTLRILAKLLESVGKFDLIITGEASMDMVSSQIAPGLSAIMGIPAITYARTLEVENGKVKATRDLEDRLEIVETELPAIVSVTGEINRPRIPTLLQIRRAFAKPLKIYKLSDLGIEAAKPVSVGDIKVIAVKRKNIIIEGDNLEEVADKLVEALIQEGILKA